ncbi:MAG: hypothetical protein V4555_16925 [Acidobacteriota bacterium]
MQHPDISTLEAYAGGSLGGPQLLELGDHIAVCEQCRTQLQSLAFGRPPALDMEPFLGEDSTQHLSEEELAAAAAQPATLDEEARLHLATCSACQGELDAVRRFYTPVIEMRPAAATGAKTRLITPRRFTFAALAAAVAACMVMLPHLLRKPSAPDAPLVAQLQDAGGLLQLDARGKVRSMEPIDPADAELLAQVMSTHTLPAATSVAPGTVVGESLRSASPSADQFDIVSPRAEFTTSMPELHWQSCPGASGYRVEIYDAGFHLVAISPTLTATEWTPLVALMPDRQYRWMVKAITKHGVVTAPQPPAPEGQFEVASARTLDSIATVRKHSPDAHLLLAALYARAGMKSLAQAQVGVFAAANPGSPLAGELAQSLAGPPQSPPSITKPAQ